MTHIPPPPIVIEVNPIITEIRVIPPQEKTIEVKPNVTELTVIPQDKTVEVNPSVTEIAVISQEKIIEVTAPRDININVTNNERKEIITITSDNQTVFTLNFAPLSAQFSKLFVNGLKQQYGIDYNIIGNQLTWISSDFNLRLPYLMEIFYY